MKKIRLYILWLYLPTILFAQTNIDFEQTPVGTYTSANAVAGWTVESAANSMSFGGIACVPNPSIIWTQGSPEFSILATPIISVPYLGVLPNSPLGGANVAKLNNTSTFTAQITRISSQFQVSPIFDLLQFAFAGSFDGAHSCCESPALRIDFYNCSASLTPIPSLSFTLTPGSGQCVGVNGYSMTGMTSWTNWQLMNINLQSYIGQCIKMVITVSDCAYAGHHGTVYFDAKFTNQLIGYWYSGSIVPTATGTPVNFCSGGNQAILTAPLGYQAYQWIAPGNFPVSPPLGSIPTLTVNNPQIGSIWTCITTNNGVSSTFTFMINPSQVSVVGIGTSNSCLGGSNGSATVVANGSGSGYNYTWLNSASVTVGTNSIVSNLAPGIYSIIASAPGLPACGTAINTVVIGVQPPHEISLIKPICNGSVVLSAGGGSNFQWYNNLTAIPPPLGVSASYTVLAPTNGDVYRLHFTPNTGCNDSIKYILSTTPPGSVIANPVSFICPGNSNGTATISLAPAFASVQGPYFYSITSTGSLTPLYNYSLASNSTTTFNVSGLSVGNYNLMANDGNCTYNSTFTVNPYILNFTVSPATATICSGGIIAVGVSFSVNPTANQYSYSWSPSTFLAGTNQQTTLLAGSTPLGSITTIVYTVVVTTNAINCPSTKTISITVANPVTPTISPIPLLCSNSSPYTVSVNPSGGYFTSNMSPLTSTLNIIYPQLAQIGLNNLIYSVGSGTCLVTTSATFQVSGPIFSVSGNTLVCSGKTASFLASGASSYTWSNGSFNAGTIVTPTSTTNYSVIGSHSIDACTATKTITVNVLPSPNIQLNGNLNVCQDQNTTISATGANNYTWSTGATTNWVTLFPNANSVYTVSGINISNGCSSTKTFSIQILPKPILSIAGQGIICEGDEMNLSVSGANTYTWNNGSNNTTISVTQFSTTSYTVSGTFSNTGCSSSYTCTVITDACVSISELKSKSQTIKIFPNPSFGKIYIETKKEIEITIINELGQLILKQNLTAGTHSIDLSAYVSGIYFIKTNSNEKPEVFRLIKEE